jgi:hypothetical protein
LGDDPSRTIETGQKYLVIGGHRFVGARSAPSGGAAPETCGSFLRIPCQLIPDIVRLAGGPKVRGHELFAQRAAECLLASKEVRTPVAQQALLNMAAKYIELAIHLELGKKRGSQPADHAPKVKRNGRRSYAG